MPPHRPSRQQTPGPSCPPAASRLEPVLAGRSRQHSGGKPAYRPPRPPDSGPSGSSAALCANCKRCGYAAKDSRCPARNQRCNACSKVGHFAISCRSSASTSVRPDRHFPRLSQSRRQHSISRHRVNFQTIDTKLVDDVNSIVIASVTDYDDLPAGPAGSAVTHCPPPEVDSGAPTTAIHACSSDAATSHLGPWVAPVSAERPSASASIFQTSSAEAVTTTSTGPATTISAAPVSTTPTAPARPLQLGKCRSLPLRLRRAFPMDQRRLFPLCQRQ